MKNYWGSSFTYSMPNTTLYEKVQKYKTGWNYRRRSKYTYSSGISGLEYKLRR